MDPIDPADEREWEIHKAFEKKDKELRAALVEVAVLVRGKEDRERLLNEQQIALCAALRRAEEAESKLTHTEADADQAIHYEMMRAEEAERKLCAARETIKQFLPTGVAPPLSMPSPCRHEEEAKQLREQKDDAYTERNRVVALLSAIYPSHLCIHDPNDTAWENDWRTIVCIHSPNGQLTWHLHDSHVPLFDHLEMDHTHWDGHTTEEKYRRMDELRRCVGQDLGIKEKELKQLREAVEWAQEHQHDCVRSGEDDETKDACDFCNELRRRAGGEG